jgi:hypothetical protein
MSALKELLDSVKFWCLILAIVALGLNWWFDPFGYREWFETHRGTLAVASLVLIGAAMVLRERGK